MSSASANTITVFKRDTRALRFTFTDENGAAVDITGWKIWFTVKAKDTDTDANAKILKTQTSHLDPVNGISEIDLSSSETDLPAATYVYDIQTLDDVSQLRTVVKADFVITQDVTYATS